MDEKGRNNFHWLINWLIISENLLDRHLKDHGNKAAIIWEQDEPAQHQVVTYKLVQFTNQLT
jgi:acyl-coenzyme A synthetase/AMP-(fatty) acid ligase